MTKKTKKTDLKSDEETGVVLARAAHAPEVQEMAGDLLDQDALAAAQDDMATFESKISSLNNLSNMFDDEEDDQISLAGTQGSEHDIPASLDDQDEDISDDEGEIPVSDLSAGEFSSSDPIAIGGLAEGRGVGHRR